METKKKWYQSKIVLLASAGALIFITNLATKWLTGSGVTADQMAVIQSQYPTIANAVKSLDSGASIITVLGAVINPIIVIWRIWFTTKPVG